MATPKIRPLQVGDICITVNSKYPGINNGVMVTIIAIEPNHIDNKGVLHPYVIRRVDGQALGIVTRANKQLVWGKLLEANCTAERLQRLPDPPDEVDHQVAMMLALEAALVKMLEAKEKQEQEVAP